MMTPANSSYDLYAKFDKSRDNSHYKFLEFVLIPSEINISNAERHSYYKMIISDVIFRQKLTIGKYIIVPTNLMRRIDCWISETELDNLLIVQ